MLQVNIVLDRTYKTYIRMVSNRDVCHHLSLITQHHAIIINNIFIIIPQVACFPEQVTKFDFDDCMSGLDYSEKASYSR